MAGSIRATISMKIVPSYEAIQNERKWLYGRGVSDPLDCPWDEGWKKLLRSWEPSPLKAGGSQIAKY